MLKNIFFEFPVPQWDKESVEKYETYTNIYIAFRLFSGTLGMIIEFGTTSA